MTDGILLLDKKPGMTSFDCVRAVKREWRRTDVGHGGTLDKFASGLLPLLFGEGLKLARFFLESYPALPTYWKTYEGVFELGRATETGDPEGAVTEKGPELKLGGEQVQAAMTSFVGAPYEQMPPRFSAKKIGGTRASDLVRAGEEPELKPAMVTIQRFECLGVKGQQVMFRARCSKGTYIRSLAVDLARKLGTVAHVGELRRTGVGDFAVSSAIDLEQATRLGEAAAIAGLDVATSFLPQFALIGGELEQLSCGKIDGVAARLSNSGLAAGVYCVAQAGRPAGLFELDAHRHAVYLRGFRVGTASNLG